MWVDRQGRERAARCAPGRLRASARVPGRDARGGGQRTDDIWVLDLARQRASQTDVRLPSQTSLRCGRTTGIACCSSRRFATNGLFWQAADGTGAAERLGAGLPSGVTPDGRQVFFSSAPGARDLMLLTLDGTHHVEPLIADAGPTSATASSHPDGRWLAYESDSSGKFEIYVKPFPNVNAGQWRVSTAGGTRPLWAPNGQELFFVAPDGALMAVRVDARGASWSAGSPAKVLEGPYATGGPLSSRNYDVSPTASVSSWSSSPPIRPPRRRSSSSRTGSRN